MGNRLLLASAALPGAMTAYLAADSGGYFPGAPALIAAQLLLLIAAYALLARRGFRAPGPGLVIAVAALGGFAAWALASSSWSGSPARALPEYTRALCYLATLVLFGVLPYSARRVRYMAYGVALAITTICAVALLSRTAPDLVSGIGRMQKDRLSYPLDYWNALGIFAGLGIILCGHFACGSRGTPAIRVAGAAAVPLLTATVYYTFSRGAVWGTVVGVCAYLVLARPHGLLSAALATAPASAVALLVVNPASNITAKPRMAPETLATGHRTALALLGCVVAAGAIRAALVPLDGRLANLRFAPVLGRRALVGVGAAALVLALAGSAALHVPSVIADKYRTFKAPDSAVGGSGTSRFLNTADNGRIEHWQVALDGYHHDHLRGSGAGTYQLAWVRERPTPADAHDGHSLYIETLGELGIVGLALLAVCLALLFAGFARRIRGPERELFAALLAAGIAWALVAALDWVWEMPAVTLWLFALGGAALARPAGEGQARRSAGLRAGGVALRVAAAAACVLLAVLPGRLAIAEAHAEKGIAHLHEGDCVAARAEAERAIDLLDRRASPHHIAAWCLLRGQRPRAAARELSLALDRDPGSWALLETLAVARAASGRDPRPALEQAMRANPRNDTVRAAVLTLAHRTSAVARARAARHVRVPIPEVGDP